MWLFYCDSVSIRLAQALPIPLISAILPCSSTYWRMSPLVVRPLSSRAAIARDGRSMSEIGMVSSDLTPAGSSLFIGSVGGSVGSAIGISISMGPGSGRRGRSGWVGLIFFLAFFLILCLAALAFWAALCLFCFLRCLLETTILSLDYSSLVRR